MGEGREMRLDRVLIFSVAGLGGQLSISSTPRPPISTSIRSSAARHKDLGRFYHESEGIQVTHNDGVIKALERCSRRLKGFVSWTHLL